MSDTPTKADATSRAKEKEQVIKAVKAIKSGPRALRMYMEMCAKCGTCASACPIYYGKGEKRYNPAERSDLIRRIYRKYCTISGRLFGRLAGAADITPEELDEWENIFYECTACRRCATFCPFGIDHSVITRKGRAILDQLGRTPVWLQKVIDTSLDTGNTDGANPAGFRSSIEFLEEEMEEEHGEKIAIPVDVEGADYFFVPPSGDVLVMPEATMGVAKVFHVLGLGDKWTMSSSFFDGANYGLFTGNDKAMKDENKAYVDEAKKLKAKILLMGECGHAHRIMKMMTEKGSWWGQLPFEITNCMQWTANLVREGKLEFDKSKNTDPVTYHDPCNFAKSCNIVDEPREILKAACDDFREMTPNRHDNWCCGGGGGLAAMDEIQEFRMNVSGRKKLEQIRATGAKLVTTACANCKRQLSQLLEYHKEDVEILGVHDMLSRSILINGKAAEREDWT